MERADTVTYYRAAPGSNRRARPIFGAFHHCRVSSVPTHERIAGRAVWGVMKSLRLIIGVMVLLPVWSQTVPESISNEILEELKRVEYWEAELNRARRLSAQ